MGRQPEGPKLIWRNGWASVRFTWRGRRETISTGERDPERAQVVAAQIYAEVISGKRRKVSAAVLVTQPLDVLFAEWLATLIGVLDERTVDTYQNTYVKTHFMPYFRTFERVSDAGEIDAYARERVRRVLRKTVHKELGALRGFLRWCKAKGLILALPEWPDLPRTAKGKRAGKQRAKPNILSEADVVNAIGTMPLMSARISKATRRRFVVRPRFVVAYETGLRPSTLDALSVPEHWRPGRTTLTIADEDDKARFGRELALTTTARAALEEAVTAQGLTSGLIFGDHDYRTYLAASGIPKLASYDLRHARATHMINRGATLAGVAYNHGHTQLTTTAKYTHPTKEAGDAAASVGGALDSGSVQDQEDRR